MESLFFQNFEVKIFNFVSDGQHYTSNYGGNEDRSIIPTQFDTIFIAAGDGWYINNKTLRIISKFKLDSFAVSFAYGIRFYEGFTEPEKYEDDELVKKLASWYHYSKYVGILRVSKNQFKINASQPYNDQSLYKSITREYHLRDTAAVYYHESGPTNYEYTQNGKLFAVDWHYLYLRIKRFRTGKLKETKYVRVALSEECD